MHPDTVTVFFLHFVADTRDIGLLDMAPDDIRRRLEEFVDRLKEEEVLSFYDTGGRLIDYTNKARVLSEL